MRRGKFIVIEGGEGSGKTTCLSILKDKFKEEDTIFTREPGGTFVAEKIRGIFLEDHDEGLTVEAELMLINAARSQHIEHVIKPALHQGKHVFCDRFDASTFVYQIHERCLDNIKYRGLHEQLLNIVAGVIYPDLCIYLDVDPLIGIERIKKRNSEETRFDKANIAVQERRRGGYKKYIKSRYVGKSHLIIDANRQQSEVQHDVLMRVKNLLGNNEE